MSGNSMNGLGGQPFGLMGLAVQGFLDGQVIGAAMKKPDVVGDAVNSADEPVQAVAGEFVDSFATHVEPQVIRPPHASFYERRAGDTIVEDVMASHRADAIGQIQRCLDPQLWPNFYDLFSSCWDYRTQQLPSDHPYYLDASKVDQGYFKRVIAAAWLLKYNRFIEHVEENKQFQLIDQRYIQQGVLASRSSAIVALTRYGSLVTLSKPDDDGMVQLYYRRMKERPAHKGDGRGASGFLVNPVELGKRIIVELRGLPKDKPFGSSDIIAFGTSEVVDPDQLGRFSEQVYDGLTDVEDQVSHTIAGRDY